MDKQEQVPTPENPALMHEVNPDMNKPLFTKSVLLILLVVALLGVGTGYMLAKNKNGGSSSGLGGIVGSGGISKGTTEGSNDTNTFKDTAEGVLQNGGIGGEGQYHLVRPGGDSQSVYLTSSIVDLSKYLNRKIKVWGQTQTAKKAGWLMDVGRVEVLE